MNIIYLYLAHVVGTPVASVVGFASAVMTLSKTVLYWLQEYYCNGCSVGHNSMKDLIILWVIPNGFVLLTCITSKMVIFSSALVTDCGSLCPAASSGNWARTSPPPCTLAPKTRRKVLLVKTNEGEGVCLFPAIYPGSSNGMYPMYFTNVLSCFRYFLESQLISRACGEIVRATRSKLGGTCG